MRLSRRQWIKGGIVLGVGGLVMDAFALEPRWLDVSHHTVHFPDLPSELIGFRTAQLTDVHLSGANGLHDAIAEALAIAKPDLVVVTGDVIDSSDKIQWLAPFIDRLRWNGANTKVIATLGNWEHWGHVDLSPLRAEYAKAGAELVVNDNRLIDRGLVVVATDDGCTDNADLTKSLRSARGGRPRLLLSHAPGIVDEWLGGEHLTALALAGHTHGGQVRAITKEIFVPPGSGRFVAGRL
jgi:predicted MPP superfamily phosphohydrolase